MRLLGKCPSCGAVDSIFTDEDASSWKGRKKASCNQCGKSWEDWLSLVSAEERKRGRLIPVRIEVYQNSVEVVFPSIREIPCARFIVSVLNTALMARFNLQVCFATEGGMEGVFRREPIELRNSGDMIGLWDEHRFPKNPVCQGILNWYADVLRLLFEDELIVDGKDFGRGEILKLAPDDSLYEERVKVLLWHALWKKAGNRRFANAVFERLKIELAGTAGLYIAGLTSEDVVRFFVPPPMSRG